MRLALALALDKLGLIQSALGVSRAEAKALVAWTPWVNVPGLVQPFTDKTIDGQWDPVARRYVIPGRGRALADARILIQKTACRDGCTLDFFTTSGNPVRQAQESVIAANWKWIGVELNPHFVPLSAFLAGWNSGGLMAHGAFQVGMFAWGASPDPDYLKFMTQSRYIDREQSVHVSLNRNYAGIHDALIDRDFNRAARSFNRTIRYRNYAAIQSEMNKRAYWICLFFRPQINTSDPRVGNFEPGPLAASWWNTFEWKALGS
jgi:ABC-type transport system substrate-binding protein